MTTAVVIIAIVLCVLLSALFSGSEMALSSCNQVRLENEADEGRKSAKRALKLATDYDDTLSAILVGNNLVNTAASSLTTVLIILLTGSDSLNWLGTLIVTVAVIIFGETIPKIICKKYANRFAEGFSGIIQLIVYLFWPLDFVIVGIISLITKPIHDDSEKADEEESVEELQSIIETAEDEGILDSDRSEIVSAAIDFSDINASDVMTARVDMEAIDIEDDPEEIFCTILKSSHSRLPVYEGSIDHIIGILHLNHYLKARAESSDADIRSLLLKPCYVYKTMKLPKVLDNLKDARQHLAIVTDEYSGTLGVISMEDVLEQIVGDIWDETDTVEEEVVRLSEGRAVIDGDMNMSDFLELAGLNEEDFDYESETAGGFAIEYLGDFPEENETFVYKDIRFTVMEMGERRVEKLLVERIEKQEED